MLRQRYNAKHKRMEYALVSTKDETKILQWFGVKKPNEERVKGVERRVEYFKHAGQS